MTSVVQDFTGRNGDDPPAWLPWVRRLAAQIIAGRDLDNVLRHLEADERDAVISCVRVDLARGAEHPGHAVVVALLTDRPARRPDRTRRGPGKSLARRRRRRDGAA